MLGERRDLIHFRLEKDLTLPFTLEGARLLERERHYTKDMGFKVNEFCKKCKSISMSQRASYMRV